MKFIQHYSGSSGNLYEIVANNGKRLIIDPGVAWKKLLEAFEFRLSNVEACFVSHSHKDHCKAIDEVRTAGIEIYASLGTLEAVGWDAGRKINPVINKTLVRTETFSVYCFDTIHDAPEPMGFVVRERETGEFLLFVTDTKCVKQKFPYKFSIIAIECSYNGPYLAKKVEAGTINEALAKRLLTSHMEESEALRYLTGNNADGEKICDLSECREVHLLHMSADNINKERVVKEYEKELFLEVRTV